MGEGTRGVREGRRMSFEEGESDDKLVSSVAGTLCSRDRLLLCIGRGRLARAGLVRRRPRGLCRVAVMTAARLMTRRGGSESIFVKKGIRYVLFMMESLEGSL